MARYIRKLGRIGHALGPSEERGFAMWAGYDIEGVDGDLSHLGLTRVDDWSAAQLAEFGVAEFMRVPPGDHAIRRKLGLEE